MKSLDPCYWDETLLPRWFRGGPERDEEVRAVFGEDVEKAMAGEYDSWKSEEHSAVALLVLLDQFTRNIFRGTPKAFSMDAEALAIAKSLLPIKRYTRLKLAERVALIMPMQHSENLEDQELGVALAGREMERMGDFGPMGETAKQKLAQIRDYAIKHRDVVKQYGRLPHRNQILDRENTAEEQQAFDAGTMPSF